MVELQRRAGKRSVRLGAAAPGSAAGPRPPPPPACAPSPGAAPRDAAFWILSLGYSCSVQGRLFFIVLVNYCITFQRTTVHVLLPHPVPVSSPPGALPGASRCRLRAAAGPADGASHAGGPGAFPGAAGTRSCSRPPPGRRGQTAPPGTEGAPEAAPAPCPASGLSRGPAGG